MDMHLISRLRDDADLQYLYKGKTTGKKGRPKKYDGKIDHTNIRKDYFKLVSQNDNATIYCAEVYSKSLKRNIKLVHVIYTNRKGNKIYKLYFSTDLTLEPLDILDYYKSRFQIEFLYRDGKQYTGLNDSLTAINIAKVVHW